MGFRSQVNKDRFFLWQIGVNPEYRKNGLAKQLLIKLEDAAKKIGCRYLELTVDPENIPSRKFFEKNGYRNVSSTQKNVIDILNTIAVKDYYGAGRHFILYEKKLS